MQFYVGRELQDHVSLKDAPGQMMKGSIEEAEWWTSTYASEMTEDITIYTRTGRHIIPFDTGDKILDYSFNQAGKTQDCVEERMQNANKAWWRSAMICRSKDVPWRVKCRSICGTRPQCILLWEREPVLESSHFGQNYGMGNRPGGVCLAPKRKKARIWQNTTQGLRGLQERFGQR